MKRILAAMILLSAFSIYAAETTSLRSGAYFCGTDGSCYWYPTTAAALERCDNDSDFVFKHWTYIMGYADCPNDIGTWRTKTPDCQLILYTSGTDMAPKKAYTHYYAGSGKPAYVRDRMVQLGDIEEKAYLHFYNDTKLRNWNSLAYKYDTVTISGTHSMTIDAGDSISRVPNGYVSALFVDSNTYEGSARLSPNFTNTNLRLAYKEYITFIWSDSADVFWPTKDTTQYWDGIYFDNYSPTGMKGGGLVSGGLVVESGVDSASCLTFASDAYASWGWELMKTFGREVHDTLATSATWSRDGKHKILAYNAGISYKDAYADADSSGADAINYEFGFSPVYTSNNESVYRLENLYTHDSAAAENGVTPFWCSVPHGTPNVLTVQQGIYNNLCFYYVARADSTWIFMRPSPGNAYGVFYNPGFDTLAWIDAMNYEIGVPTAHYTLDTSCTSPDSATKTAKIFSREYTYAKVFIRPRDGFDVAYGLNSIPIVYDLGSEYRKLAIDGTLDPIITSLSLRGGEGAILLPASGGTCAEPPSIPALSSPADSATVASTTPSLCVTNSTQPDTCLHAIVYHFRVAADSTFTYPVAENVWVTEGVSTTCWTVTPALNPGHLYYWQCRANNGTAASNWSDWSALHRFVTPSTGLTAPTLSSPADADTGVSVTPTLALTNNSAIEGVTHYRFEVATDSLFAWIVTDSLVAQGVSTTSWAVSYILQPTTVYYWRAFAYNGIIYSDPSEIWTFTTTGGFTIIASPTSLTKSDTVGGGGGIPVGQSVFITTPSDSLLTFSVSNGSSWLSAVCFVVCQTPGQIIASISQGALPAGTYIDTITVTCVAASNSPLKIPVTLTIRSTTGNRLLLKKD